MSINVRKIDIIRRDYEYSLLNEKKQKKTKTKAHIEILPKAKNDQYQEPTRRTMQLHTKSRCFYRLIYF